jgi:rSAM/selenodomain-associated transferase 2
MIISVIIPTLNEERALPATLRHTLSLGFDDVIVVDGGSSDRTREIVRGFEVRGAGSEESASHLAPRTPHLRLLTSAAGRAKQMNAGAAAATGDVLLFLHADTLLPNDASDAITAALADARTLGGRFDVRFERDRGLARLISSLINLRSRRSGIATGDQAIFVRRNAFESLQGFADLPLMEDIDMTSRLKRLGRLAALRTQVVTSFRRWEGCGPIRTILLMWSLRLLYWIGVNPTRLSRLYTTVR